MKPDDVDAQTDEDDTLRDPIHADTSLNGETLGQYQLLERIGRGGQARVYRAAKRGAFAWSGPGKFFAVRVADRRIDDLQDNLAEREVAVWSRLGNHPGIAGVVDIGVTEDGRLWYAQEFVSGVSLHDVIRYHRGLPAPFALRICKGALKALSHAHACGVIHRDVKPSNILIADDTHAKLIDFGLATLQDAPPLSAGIKGTPGYIAPELLQGAAASARSDLWSLGVAVCELVTGRGQRSAATIDGELGDFLRKMTARNPEDRFATADEALAWMGQASFRVAQGQELKRFLSSSGSGPGAADSGSMQQAPSDSPVPVQRAPSPVVLRAPTGDGAPAPLSISREITMPAGEALEKMPIARPHVAVVIMALATVLAFAIVSLVAILHTGSGDSGPRPVERPAHELHVAQPADAAPAVDAPAPDATLPSRPAP